MDARKPIIGILGGIGSGKSTVACEFAKLGCGVIDADKIAGEMLGNESIKNQIREVFGCGCFDGDGSVNRGKLAEIVFESRDSVVKINSIIHPGVLEKTHGLVLELGKKSGVKAIVLDMPLLLEAGYENVCDVLVYIECNDKVRLMRAENGPNAKKNLKKRENFQISLDNKREIAHYTICNNSDLPALAGRVETIFANIIRENIQL